MKKVSGSAHNMNNLTTVYFTFYHNKHEKGLRFNKINIFTVSSKAPLRELSFLPLVCSEKYSATSPMWSHCRPPS